MAVQSNKDDKDKGAGKTSSAKDTGKDKAKGAADDEELELDEEGADDEADEEEQTDEKDVLTFDKWLPKQPAAIRAVVDGHVAGLKSALSAERTQRKDLEKQLKKLHDKTEEGSDLRTQVEKIQGDLSAKARESAFYADAHNQGARNLRSTFLVLSDAKLIDEDGETDWDEAKRRHPELFQQAEPQNKKKTEAKGNAGNGTKQETQAKTTMNDFIRGSARGRSE